MTQLRTTAQRRSLRFLVAMAAALMIGALTLAPRALVAPARGAFMQVVDAVTAPLLLWIPVGEAERVLNTLLFVPLGAAIALLLTRPAWPAAPFAPTADEGLIAEGAVVRLSDGDVPAVSRLDPALRDAMRQAEADAAAEGLAFEVTSGWRSARYQQWLLEDAVELYASEEVARQFVATPERSSHVTGRALDIAPVDAQFWLIEHGARYGICQTYANERWHFELVIEPGGVCPPMKPDAAS